MDVGGNMNPFLFDDPAPPPSGDSTDMNNPFLNGGGFDFTAESYSGINPFSDQVDDSSAADMNLFGDDATSYSAEMNPFGVSSSAVNFFDTTSINQESSGGGGFNIFGSIPQQDEPPSVDFFNEPSSLPAKPPPPRPPSPSNYSSSSDAHNVPARPPPPRPPARPPPPSKETKDLLQTVIGAMEATTDTLQDKLNTTVTPCPSPGKMHASRSPTPDIQITGPDKEPDAFSTIFGQTIEELSDTEAEADENLPSSQPTSTEPNASAAEGQKTENDIDLFGEPIVQTKTKTTQDILSLFNKPSESNKTQVDLLSDDLISDGVSSETQDVVKAEDAEPSPFDLLSADVGPNNSDLSQVTEMSSVEASDDLIASIDKTEDQTGTHLEEDSETLVKDSDAEGKSETQDEVQSVEAKPVDSDHSDSLSIGKEIDHKVLQTVESGDESVSKEEPNEHRESLTNTAEIITEFSDVFGVSPQIVAEPTEKPITSSSVPETDVADIFGGPPPASDILTEEFSVKEEESSQNIFGLPSSTPASASEDIFGTPHHGADSIIDTFSGEPVVSSEIADGIFGPEITSTEKNLDERKTSVHSIPNVEVPNIDIFGVGSQEVDIEPSSPFLSAGAMAPHPTPASMSSKGFDIFGSDDIMPTSPVQPVPSGAETTGATLFETPAPAPNVGMSLFGAGEEASLDIFAESAGNTMINPFAPAPTAPTSIATLASVTTTTGKETLEEDFDAFSARFENVTNDLSEPSFDPFTGAARAASPWGDAAAAESSEGFGFGDDAKFDPFLSLNEPPPVPQSTPRKVKRDDSKDSDDTPMNVVIRPSAFDGSSPIPPTPSPVPVLAPPPAVLSASFTDSTPRFNPFDKTAEDLSSAVPPGVTAFPAGQGELQRSESQETPPTPLFEEDQSVPLEPFLRTNYDGRTWEMHLRQPNKKKITGQRFWKKVYVKLTDAGALQLYNNTEDKEPFQELPLQPCYSVSDIGAQQFDQFGKIFTVKIQYIFYKERPGVRPGQISKAERITNKLSKFAQYAIAGDYEGVKEFASDVRKLGMPVEHAPQISQLLKLGTQNYEDLKLFSSLVEEFMFKLTVHRDRALTYKSEEVQLTAVDEIFVEQDLKGVVNFMVARVRIFFLGFLSGMPEVDLGINDLRKQGHEVVGRHDIIPVITEEWIRLEDIEFHCTVNQEEFDKTRHIKFKPPDACYIELMRYRVRPPKNRELPLQIKTKFIIQGKRVEVHSEILVPGFSGRKLGQVPCEDVAVRFPLPECWIYMFRVEKHFRYGSVKSAHRRTGKVKGMERFKGAVDTPEAALMEVTSGQAKYEHQHRAIVWRMSRLPKEGQGAYSVHQFTCRMNLTAYDQIPPTLDKFCVLEFTMPATTVSHCVMRSVSVTSEEPPEKYVRYLARHEYKVEIEFSSGTGPNEYIAATMKDQEKDAEAEKVKPAVVQEESSSDEST